MEKDLKLFLIDNRCIHFNQKSFIFACALNLGKYALQKVTYDYHGESVLFITQYISIFLYYFLNTMGTEKNAINKIYIISFVNETNITVTLPKQN